MADLLQDIIDYLTETEVITGIDTFKDTTPATPDTLVAVYEYLGGPPPMHADVAQRSVQIVVRNKRPTLAREKALEIYNVLNSPDKYLDITETRWSLVHLRNTPIKIKVDDANRHYYGFNVGITTYTD